MVTRTVARTSDVKRNIANPIVALTWMFSLRLGPIKESLYPIIIVVV